MPRFSPEILAKYPHMAPQDIPVWELFLREQGKDFTGFDYDVRVGTGTDPGEDYDASTRKDAILLTQKRIDAIGFKDNEIWIIEVKPQASISALGQILTYTDLFLAHKKPILPVRSVVVCSAIDPEVRDTFKKNNVTLIQV
jgi:hypothetical protein